MNKKIIEQKIISYIKTSYQWHETDEGNFEGLLGQEMIELEEEILTSFGLPFMAFQYSDIMQREGFLNENIEIRAKKLSATLKIEAEDFLLSPIEKDSKILIDAKSIFKDVVEVLPMIGITTTPYNCFLYYDKFFREILNENELLDILKKNENLDNVSETRIPSTYKELSKKKVFKKLVDQGLPYIDDYRAFVKCKETIDEWDEHISNYDLGDYFGLPDVVYLTHFYIRQINFRNENTCLIKIIIEHGGMLVELTLWCTADMMRVFMLHSKYYSLAIPPMYIINCTSITNREIEVNLKQSIGKNIEIVNLNIEIERLDDEDDEIQNPFDYVVTSLNVSETISIVNWKSKNDDLPF